MYVVTIYSCNSMYAVTVFIVSHGIELVNVKSGSPKCIIMLGFHKSGHISPFKVSKP